MQCKVLIEENFFNEVKGAMEHPMFNDTWLFSSCGIEIHYHSECPLPDFRLDFFIKGFQLIVDEEVSKKVLEQIHHLISQDDFRVELYKEITNN